MLSNAEKGSTGAAGIDSDCFGGSEAAGTAEAEPRGLNVPKGSALLATTGGVTGAFEKSPKFVAFPTPKESKEDALGRPPALADGVETDPNASKGEAGAAADEVLKLAPKASKEEEEPRDPVTSPNASKEEEFGRCPDAVGVFFALPLLNPNGSPTFLSGLNAKKSCVAGAAVATGWLEDEESPKKSFVVVDEEGVVEEEKFEPGGGASLKEPDRYSLLALDVREFVLAACF
jgi:hypothetical protein